MALLQFEVRTAELVAEIGMGVRTPPALFFTVRPSSGSDDVELRTGEKFRDLDGYVRVNSDAEGPREQQVKVGTLHYFAKSDSERERGVAHYVVEAYLPQTEIDDVAAAVRMGHAPSEISVSVLGMTPVGIGVDDGAIWNNHESPTLPLTFVRFTIPLVANLPHETMPATRGQFTQLLQSLEQARAEIRSRLTAILWTVTLLGALVLILK
jgi:hypothetical protein